MKQILLLACITMLTATQTSAQTEVEAFKQPYAPGQLFPSEHFTGRVWLSKLIHNDSLHVAAFNVTFAPTCINSWHYHTGGQILVATAGVGYYQEKGRPARRLHPGDIVEVDPNVEHWHGAAPDSWFSHVAVSCNPESNRTVWLSPVGQGAYREAVTDGEAYYQAAREALSPRQHAIVELGVYTAHGDLNGLRTAIAGAFESGMTQNEVKEVFIHAYAYCGFPRSLRALQTMMDVMDERQAAGISDPVGREASPAKARGDKYTRGQNTLSELMGMPSDGRPAGYAEFAPTIDRFLKEHLFADIFERDVLSYRDRELATLSILAGVGGVEPMARAHMGICLHLEITPRQLSALLDIVAYRLGTNAAEPLRVILQDLQGE